MIQNGTLWAHFGTLIFGMTGKRYTFSYFTILYSKLPFEERFKCTHHLLNKIKGKNSYSGAFKPIMEQKRDIVTMLTF